MIRKHAFVVLIAGCAAACTTAAPPEQRAYLLRAAPSPGLAPADPDAMVGFGPVRVAPYLDNAGLMVEVGENEVREARNHVWAEPLDRGVQIYLAERVAGLVGHELNAGFGGESDWRYRVDVEIVELQGALSGEVTLTGRWELVDRRDRRVVAGARFARSQAQVGAGYPGLVATEAKLLDGLAEAIAGALGGVGAPAAGAGGDATP